MKKLLSLLLAFIMVISIFAVVPTTVRAASSKTLYQDATLLRAVGKQTPYTYSCACFSLAYCRTMLDGKTHYYYEYNTKGVQSETNISCGWGLGDYYTATANNKTAVFKALYNSINNNRPAIVYVYDKYSSEHWVAIVGYKNVSDTNSLSESNFLMIDPLDGYQSTTQSLSQYKLLTSGGVYRYALTNSGSVSGGHTHSYTTHSHYGSEHPHYEYLKCSCGATQVNTSKTSYNSNCDKCVLSNVHMSCSKKALPVGETNTFTFGATNATSYLIGINRNGQRIITEEVTSGKSYTFDQAGNYTAYVTCRSNAGGGNIDTNVVSFTVYEPAIMGDKFVAYIVNHVNNNCVTGAGINNVEMQDKNGSDSQKWLFELQSDNTYKITNLEYNKCMDVSNYLTANGTNIQLVASNDLAAQRFYLIYNDSGYSFAPKHCTSSVIDIADNSLDNGANVQLWEWSNNDFYQTFTIEYIELVPRETQTYNGNTYEYYDVSMPWSQANEFCEKQGGHLVTISSKEENDVVLNMANKYGKSYCWLGATDYSSEGNWYWVKPEKFTYTNWSDTQPDNYYGVENFMVMYTTGDIAGKWNDLANISASQKKIVGFICEYENSVDASSYTPTKTFEYDNKKYEIYDNTVDWHTAQELCEAKGGHLVTFKDVAENDAIFNEVQSCGKESYWLGYTDVISEGDWKAVDAPNEVLTYTNWKAGEPGNGFTCEDYIFMRKSSSQWEDLKGFSFGYHNIGFICEYELEEPDMLLGDVDGDKKVNIMDATAIQKFAASMLTLSEEAKKAADVDGDGFVTVLDATKIQMYLAGNIANL